ncbi:MAG: hypothetical protein ABII90_05500 [Bacteroidota bacterium]
MKQLLTILFALLFGSQQTYAQVSKKLESFREKVLPEYSIYFNQVELTENGQLNLSAVDKYIGLSADGKKAIMVNITKAWQETLVLVNYGSKRELWGWIAETGSAKLLDEWDFNAPQLVKMPTAIPQKMNLHPWFFYVGGQLGGDNQKNINLSFNTRFGFFLLINRLDFATTLSAGVTGNVNNTITMWSNFGLMSRVHFPIKKYGISPNIGGEITTSSFGKTQPTVSGALVLGISWFVGFGSLDIGIKIGNVVTGMGGYTMVPNGSKRADQKP